MQLGLKVRFEAQVKQLSPLKAQATQRKEQEPHLLSPPSKKDSGQVQLGGFIRFSLHSTQLEESFSHFEQR